MFCVGGAEQKRACCMSTFVLHREDALVHFARLVAEGMSTSLELDSVISGEAGGDEMDESAE
jgi:hypothetical protein